MTSVQPALDGTIPPPTKTAARRKAETYLDWIDEIRPAFEQAAATGLPFTTSEIQQRYDLPDPPDPAHHWGHAALRFQAEHIFREWSTARSQRATVHKSRVTQWIGCTDEAAA
ncbi:hypothetical protein [Streptomyces erythrochromogenes]|uniref:hypothetical protein n=1 Tax=Streptomyces erythrochromogenes TaxID=285574 RepID=UPI00224F453F|nr:hypothetical protein [Streptomyces erythrochromogenes]MCX5584232.1 hypothetical protein [Streptomyces erythrochromogenes]